MAFYGTNFIYDDIPSETYGLKIGYFDKGKKFGSSGSNVEIIENKIRRNPVPNFFGVEITPPLSFEMVVFSETPLDSFDRRAIGQWLFGRQEYKFLQIEQPDLEGVFFKCLLLNPEDIYIGNQAYAKKFTVRCDAPWAWSGEKTDIYNLTTLTTDIDYINYSDSDDYLYPQIEFINSTSEVDFKIQNISDNNRLFEFTGLDYNEVLNINNSRQIITSSTENIRLNDFNLKWFRLVIGLNQLTVTGKGVLKITSRFPVKVGG